MSLGLSIIASAIKKKTNLMARTNYCVGYTVHWYELSEPLIINLVFQALFRHDTNLPMHYAN